MKYNKSNIIICLIAVFNNFLFSGEPVDKNNAIDHHWSGSTSGRSFGRVGEFGFPSNPMNDRARGYLLKGKAQAAITNYGRIIDWDHHPPGLWGNYTYLPAVGFVAGIPGHSYSYKYEWYNYETNNACPDGDDGYVIWCSDQAYQDPNGSFDGFSWYENGDTNFVSVVFEAYNDDGILGEKLCSPYEVSQQSCLDEDNQPIFIQCDFDDINQYCIDDSNQLIMISLPESEDFNVNPENANVYGDNLLRKGVGFVFPWAMRPSLKQRLDDFDLYDYGDDLDAWTNDDDYDYYGSNVAESWFSRWNPSSNTDWHASTRSRENTHNTLVNESDIFGDINYLDTGTYPVLAHSAESDTWPTDYNDEGQLVPTWPGWYAESYAPEETDCIPAARYNDKCWVSTDRFISDMDVYMEFDDRWAHRGNMVSNNEYEQTGYPMGLRVMAEAHSYGISFAEDIIFVTVLVRNESGDNWCAFERDDQLQPQLVKDDQGNLICGDAMVMPDGTKLNSGKGFNYKSASMGFYMDADVVTSNRFGSFGVHTNDDDFMEYFDCRVVESCIRYNFSLNADGNCCEVINDDTLRVSMAMIYDYDFGPPEDIGIVATQLLDSPYAQQKIDFDGDGILGSEKDIFPGDKLKMTDWHWFSWYNRPGVTYQEGDAGCCAGDPGKSQARNKEDIMYKIIAGDTTNLSNDEKDWYFHTDNPTLDDPNTLNPHRDSLEGLAQTTFFQDDPDGLDAVLQMSSGPFSLEVGEQVPFSFCIIFGQNKDDLIKNATFAQLMYNSHYQGYTSPDTPTLTATIGEKNTNEEFYDGQHHCINLSWDKAAENSTDVVTGYSDFEGYNIYRSTDGGLTWGDPEKDLYDVENPDSWVPHASFHLTAEQDYNHCTFSNDYHGDCSISNPDYYILSSCHESCQLLDDDGVVQQAVNCKDEDGWVDCIEDTCQDNSITVDAYINLPDLDQLNYSPVFSVVDCDDSRWGGNEDGIPDIRGYNVCGTDTNNLIKGPNALGDCDALGEDNQEIGLKHSFKDCEVIDGMQYTYAVTAFDTGIPTEYLSDFNEEYGIYNQTINTANPLGFAAPNGYQSIESSRGRTENDKNYVTVRSGSNSTQGISQNIKAVPNPFLAHSGFEDNEYRKQIRFTNLPTKCKLTIFTISGEKVVTLMHDDEVDSNLFWDVRTLNNQEVAPGLYIFAVENLVSGHEGEKFIGKFAVVR